MKEIINKSLKGIHSTEAFIFFTSHWMSSMYGYSHPHMYMNQATSYFSVFPLYNDCSSCEVTSLHCVEFLVNISFGHLLKNDVTKNRLTIKKVGSQIKKNEITLEKNRTWNLEYLSLISMEKIYISRFQTNLNFFHVEQSKILAGVKH